MDQIGERSGDACDLELSLSFFAPERLEKTEQLPGLGWAPCFVCEANGGEISRLLDCLSESEVEPSMSIFSQATSSNRFRCGQLFAFVGFLRGFTREQ